MYPPGLHILLITIIFPPSSTHGGSITYIPDINIPTYTIVTNGIYGNARLLLLLNAIIFTMPYTPAISIEIHKMPSTLTGSRHIPSTMNITASP